MVTVIVDPRKLNTDFRRNRAIKIQDEMNEVINSGYFKSRCLELFSVIPGERSKWATAMPIDIYNHFMSGWESLDPVNDKEIEIIWDDYYTFKRVIGMTYNNKRTIYSNTKYLDTMSNNRVGSNLSHEYGHKCGFSHDFMATKTRPKSICYLINKAYEESHMRLIGRSEPPKKPKSYRRWYKPWTWF